VLEARLARLATKLQRAKAQQNAAVLVPEACADLAAEIEALAGEAMERACSGQHANSLTVLRKTGELMQELGYMWTQASSGGGGKAEEPLAL